MLRSQQPVSTWGSHWEVTIALYRGVSPSDWALLSRSQSRGLLTTRARRPLRQKGGFSGGPSLRCLSFAGVFAPPTDGRALQVWWTSLSLQQSFWLQIRQTLVNWWSFSKRSSMHPGHIHHHSVHGWHRQGGLGPVVPLRLHIARHEV